MGALPKHYDSGNIEQKWSQYWQESGIYRFQPVGGHVYSIDTPPPTVSGDLHMGHCYSYSQTDFYARFQRMNGKHVFYPMGWDDNGLPTERLVEKTIGITPERSGTEAFIQAIVNTSRQLEQKYEQLWRRLGLSVDWDHTYSTISPSARKVAQFSFIDLYKKGRVYRSSSPTIWCPFCKTAIAHAELEDKQRQTEMITIAFKLDDDQVLPIATTRPELLPACVAVFVNPDDDRNNHLIGRKAKPPLFKKEVPILSDPKADPQKGTGIVMCCTFGDTTDIKWWQEHHLPSINLISPDGRLEKGAGFLAGLDIKSARKRIIEELNATNLILDKKEIVQTVSVHDRCDTPIEFIETKQWFVKVLDQKNRLLEAGRKVHWHPAHMLSRYEDWVQNLEWDWCISRQRHHGVPFPLWYCVQCGAVLPADITALPVDPRTSEPSRQCACGGREFTPEISVMDTWATSSLSPQIAGKWLEHSDLFNQVFPMSLRPQAHDIVRTWTFYTIVMSLYHFDKIPWSDIAISGHGLSPEGHKVSKSKGGSMIDPLKVMEKYSADAVRYWAASSRLGEDSMINEDKIAAGQRLVTKLWNVAAFSYPFLNEYIQPDTIPHLLPTDKWVLSRLQQLIIEVTQAFREYDHTQAKSKIEAFFWDVIADNYLEMVKNRLYGLVDGTSEKESARYTLHHTILTVLKILAPIMPYVTEEIRQSCFSGYPQETSIHLAHWPETCKDLIDTEAEALGLALVDIATTVRRFKSEKQLAMGSSLNRIVIVSSPGIRSKLQECLDDIKSVTRAKEVELSTQIISRESASDSSINITVIEANK
jgi:valyl-tRNA synthetase